MVTTTADAVAAEPAAAPLPRRRRWLRRVLIVGLVVGLLAVFHQPILRGIALGIVADRDDRPADVVVVMGGYGPFAAVPVDDAARLSAKPASRILVIEDRSARTAPGDRADPRVGPAQGVGNRGVPAEAISVLVVTTRGDRESIHCLRTWLGDHPDLRVTLLCDELSSRRAATMIRQTLAPAEAERVRLQPLPDRRFDPDTWWRSRQGIITVLTEYTALACTLAKGEEEYSAEWDPDEYERKLSKQ